MRYFEIICEAKKPVLADYLALGIDAPTAEQYFKSRVPLDRAAGIYKEQGHWSADSDGGFARMMRWEKDHRRRQREDRAYPKFVAAIPALAAASTPLTHEQACAVIAYDDDLFSAIDTHIGSPDWFEDDPAVAARLLTLIQRIKPFKHPPLFRGQCIHRYAGEHRRGFHSWTLNRDTAADFYKDCGRGMGELWRLIVPIKGIEFQLIGTWRMRLTSESHYIGSQSEWLVLDGYPHTVIDRW